MYWFSYRAAVLGDQPRLMTAADSARIDRRTGYSFLGCKLQFLGLAEEGCDDI